MAIIILIISAVIILYCYSVLINYTIRAITKGNSKINPRTYYIYQILQQYCRNSPNMQSENNIT